MGFDTELIVGKYSAEIICQICLQIMEDPTECEPCKHIFCGKCVETRFFKDNHCPLDRKTVINRKPTTGVILKLLMRTKIKCKFHHSGCPEVLFLNEFNDHIKNCAFHPESVFICSKGCECEIKRKDVVSHDCKKHLLELIATHGNKVYGHNHRLELDEETLQSLKTEWSRVRDFIYRNYHIDLKSKDTNILYPKSVRKKLADWGNSLPLATVESWAKMYARPNGDQIDSLNNALVFSQCPSEFLDKFVKNAAQNYWPFGIADMFSRRKHSDILKSYVLRKIPKLQAVVMLFTQNEHISVDFKVYPGLIFLFENGVKEK